MAGKKDAKTPDDPMADILRRLAIVEHKVGLREVHPDAEDTVTKTEEDTA